MMEFWADWRFWGYLMALIPVAGFALLYGFRAAWWTHPVGRSLLPAQLIIVGLLGWGASTRVTGLTTMPPLLFGALVGLTAVVGWYQFVTLIRVLRDARLGRACPNAPRRRIDDPPPLRR